MANLAINEIIKMLTPLWNRFPGFDGDEGAPSAANDSELELADKFRNQLPGDFDRIDLAVVSLRSKPNDAIRNSALFSLVQDLTDRAPNFDYDLISVFGTDLCLFLESPTVLTSRGQKVVLLYVDAMKQVADKNLTGDGHAAGSHIIRNLQNMMQMILLGKIRYH